MYLLIVALPLIGTIIGGLFGYKLGKTGTAHVVTFSVGVTCLLSLFIFKQVSLVGTTHYEILTAWMNSELLSINWGFLFDPVVSIMLLVVTIVSSLVHVYSMEYMKEDPHLPRFMTYLGLFTFFMLVLVTSENLVQLFLGWEGVGLCSYLLISFWYTRPAANQAGIKAIVVNKIGDAGLLLGIVTLFLTLGAVDYPTIFTTAPYVENKLFIFMNIEVDILTLVCLLLFIGCVGKSAQLGLHTWLPDAMEGPTPVSALIHAATMVTAGVFMVIRCSPLFEFVPNILFIMTIIGATTAFFGATTGLVQNDIKKVIAYSTCSQLGYMVFACGLSGYSVSLFHLMNHAFFKALLFLGAGSVIHALADEQDMRKFGGTVNILPFTYTVIGIGSFALVGFPFLTGFYSKDAILELAYIKYSFSGHFSHWLGTMAAICTAFYSMRLIYLTFLSQPNGYRRSIELAHDAPKLILIPLIGFSLGSIWVGYLFKDMFVGVGSDFFKNSIFIAPTHFYVECEFLPPLVKNIPVISGLFGAFLAGYLYFIQAKKMLFFKIRYYQIFTFLTRKYHFDTINNAFLTFKLLEFGYNITFKLVDKGVLEVIGPYGITSIFSRLRFKFSLLQTGLIYNYALVLLIGTFVFVTALVTLTYFNLWMDTTLVYLFFICLFFLYGIEKK